MLNLHRSCFSLSESLLSALAMERKSNTRYHSLLYAPSSANGTAAWVRSRMVLVHTDSAPTIYRSLKFVLAVL